VEGIMEEEAVDRAMGRRQCFRKRTIGKDRSFGIFEARVKGSELQ